MSDSGSEASASASPPQSPGAPGLERLVGHFVEAKRSLHAASHVFRANELVTAARALVEEMAGLQAKNAYAQRGLEAQSDTLDAIREALAGEGSAVADEFDATIAALDEAHARLGKTLDQLRRTVVVHAREPAIRHSDDQAAGSASSDTGHGGSKTLFEFIDDATHEHLLASLRGLIDRYHDARSELNADRSTFEAAVAGISHALADHAHGLAGEPDRPTIYDEPPPTLAHLFHGIEDHATEMASLLENLVNHYDLSVTALRHTQGGGEAAKLAVQQTAELGAHDVAKPEESLYGQTVAESMSDGERHEMLTVLAKDAREVEDVVMEIRDRATELEGQYEMLSNHARTARQRHRTLGQVLASMRDVHAAMPRHLEAASCFRETWLAIRDQMQAKTRDLADLALFYEQFLAGYGKLLKEVERRRANEALVRRVAHKARKELDKLHRADQLARDEFTENVGVFLPRDLGVWHGLEAEAVRWEVRPVGSEHYTPPAHDRPRLLDGS